MNKLMVVLTNTDTTPKNENECFYLLIHSFTHLT